jgi:GNAT superfamily N-acetyltransferase
MEEYCNDQKELNVPLTEDSEIVILTRDDMYLLGNHEENNIKTEELIQWLEAGRLCLAFKYKGEIAAYSWCDLNYLQYKGRKVALKRNEACLFNARTYRAFRGKNLAPYVRNELCKLLKQRGIDRFLSISLWSNTASLKFKQKLGAKPIGLFLYIGLFRKFHLHFRLRNMAHSQFI